ncbi:DUF1674-domain-containing protein, partial [Eremomyces bilateralis CBS 781.70]
TTSSLLSSRWNPGPAPPRLPKEEQELFESLQRASTGAFSTPSSSLPPTADLPPTSTSPSPSASDSTQPPSTTATDANPARPASGPEMLASLKARLQAVEGGEEMHPNVRKGARPEFEGETNPTTGEVGGPKNEPLRWGVGSDWSYNGRVTDF